MFESYREEKKSTHGQPEEMRQTLVQQRQRETGRCPAESLNIVDEQREPIPTVTT